MRNIILIATFIVSFINIQAQNLEAIKKAMANASYPVMKSHEFMGVMPVQNPVLKFSGKESYKLAIDLAMMAEDSTYLNYGITDVGRTYNLHVANGALLSKMDVVVIVHGPSVWSFLNNDAFEKKYNKPNPNIAFIEELLKHGVKVYVCGQSLVVMEIAHEGLVPGVQVALSAKTALFHFQQKGYSLFYFWD